MHSLTVYYRPDNYPDWTLWKDFPPGTFEMIGIKGALDIGGNPTVRAGFWPRLSFGKPQNATDPTTKRNLRRGYQFQVKLKGTGHVVIDRFRLHAQQLIERSTSRTTALP